MTWIPVAERYPEVRRADGLYPLHQCSDEVLVTTGQAEVCIAFLYGAAIPGSTDQFATPMWVRDATDEYGYTIRELIGVVAWMPLPEPYRPA